MYECPQLEPILAPTYGCIVYQEQVMQIVRDLAGYSYGRSDLVRRAMSKKKASVMEKERQNFVYGNEEENVKGCVNNGISAEVANHIYDEMIDFAKYAFNKSHAAAYAVVSYQTAFLKCYYPVEFMAALMTSVIDNSTKVSEYIYTCRQMGIEILPPDINEGEAAFTVADGKIRYALAAIKGLGRPVIAEVVRERNSGGRFKTLKDFANRLSGKEVNKRTIESLIKAGALESLAGTRKQLMSVYVQVLDAVAQEKKNALSGQMSLFDFATEDEKVEYEISLPDVGEYDKDQLLAFEKEVLGIYVSGHPLEEYESLLLKNVTNRTLDFILDAETNQVKVEDGSQVILGGIITSKTVKTTRTNSMMAFITLEDLFGVVEVIIFPRDYEKYKPLLVEDNKILIRGKASVEEDKDAKLICSDIISFDEVQKSVWIKYPDVEAFTADEQELYKMLDPYDGSTAVVIYCEKERARKELPRNRWIQLEKELLNQLETKYTKKNIAVQYKNAFQGRYYKR